MFLLPFEPNEPMLPVGYRSFLYACGSAVRTVDVQKGRRPGSDAIGSSFKMASLVTNACLRNPLRSVNVPDIMCLWLCAESARQSGGRPWQDIPAVGQWQAQPRASNAEGLWFCGLHRQCAAAVHRRW
jgi:hypothetical protein